MTGSLREYSASWWGKQSPGSCLVTLLLPSEAQDEREGVGLKTCPTVIHFLYQDSTSLKSHKPPQLHTSWRHVFKNVSPEVASSHSDHNNPRPLLEKTDLQKPSVHVTWRDGTGLGTKNPFPTDFQVLTSCWRPQLETTAQRMRDEHLLPNTGVGKMWEWGALPLSADGVT